MKLLRFFPAIVIAIAIALTACAKSGEQSTQSSTNQTKEMKTLVAYFSASGVNKGVAEQLAQTIGADLHEITPEQPYTAADLDWQNKQSRSSVEMADSTSRPAITAKLQNIEQYDTIYVGFPIWWYTAPTIINTFMESYDFSGKTLIPFATSGGSSITKACDDLKRTYPNVNWLPGRLLNNATADQLKQWTDSL
ncbi:MAG: NAD(P)H-dependent oxidoreductase [Muribaculaceae bacterium]|nr:NAD(P)H-dependent oxidoreductase [Muribaculaceae bacterium]